MLGTEILACKYQAERGRPNERRMAGLLHIQLVLKAARPHIRYAQLNQILGLQEGQFWWKVCRSPPHAWDYCGKEDSRLDGCIPQEFGERPLERAASRKRAAEQIVDAFVETIERRGTMKELWTGEHRAVMLRNYRTYLELRNVLDQPQSQYIPPLIMYIHGKTGTDKSKETWAWIERNGLLPLVWRSPSRNQGAFFPGYDNHPVVVFEEMRYFAGGVSGFLEITDGRESRQELKMSGVTIILRARVIIITSDRPLHQVKFKSEENKYDFPTVDEQTQMIRRICMRPRLRHDGTDPPDRWMNFPLGGVYEFRNLQNVDRRGPHLRNPVLPNLTNVNRRALGLPLLSPFQEMQLFPERRNQIQIDRAMEILDQHRADIQRANEELPDDPFDDDQGLPEPQGEAV